MNDERGCLLAGRRVHRTVVGSVFRLCAMAVALGAAAPKAACAPDLLELLIVDADSGAPLADTAVGIGDENPTSRMTDRQGRLVIEVGPGNDRVRITSDGRVTTVVEGFRAGGPDVVRVPLVACGLFLGRIVEAESFFPVNGARVGFREAGGGLRAETTSDRNGDFAHAIDEVKISLESLKRASGPQCASGLRLSVEAPGFYPPLVHAQEPVLRCNEFTTDGRRSLVVLEREDVREVIIENAEGVPLEGVSVAWSWQVVRDVFSTLGEVEVSTTDRSGRFLWRTPRSAYRSVALAVHAQGGAAWFGMVKHDAASGAIVRIRLRPPVRVAGMAVTARGDGVDGAMVVLTPRDVPGFWSLFAGPIAGRMYGPRIPWKAVSDSDGRFTMEGLPAGAYEIDVLHRDCVLADAAPRELHVAEACDLTIPLVPGRAVTVAVETERGEPLACAPVRFLAERKSVWAGVFDDDLVQVSWMPVPAALAPAGEGIVRATGLPYAPLRVQAMAPGRQRTTVDLPADGAEVTIALPPEEAPPPAERAEELQELTMRFSSGGCLIDSDGVAVTLFDAGSAKEEARRTIDIRKGMARVSGLPRGTFDMCVAPHGFAPRLLRGAALPRDDVLEIELEPAPAVLVTVTPASRVSRIYALDEEGRRLRCAAVNAQGVARFCGLRPGVYRLNGAGISGEKYRACMPVILCGEEAAFVGFEEAGSSIQD